MKTRWYLYALWVLIPITLVIRTLQLQYTIDDAGFYTEQWLTLGNLTGYALLLVIAIGLVVARYGCRWTECDSLPRKSLLLGLGSLIAGICCIPQAMVDLSLATTSAQQFFFTLCISFMGIGFLTVGICHLMGKPVPFLLTALPVVGQLVRLYTNYARFNGVAKISENVITILFLCAFLLFLLSVCRMYSRLDFHKGRTFALGIGSATVLLGFLTSVPHWIVGSENLLSTFLGFGAAVYALAVTAQLGLMKSVAQPLCQQQPDSPETADPLPCETTQDGETE